VLALGYLAAEMRLYARENIIEQGASEENQTKNVSVKDKERKRNLRAL
jgi:hypothetical protein